MLEFMLGDIFVNAAVLCLILYLVAKNEADYSFAKVAMVTAVIGLGSFLIQLFLLEKIGWLTIIPVFALATAMVMIFCWVRFWKTILVVVLFCLFHVGIKIGIEDIQRRLFPEHVPVSNCKYAGWEEARMDLKLSGTLVSERGGYAAMINGEVFEEGDVVEHDDTDKTYQWKIHAITKHEIEYKQLGIVPK